MNNEDFLSKMNSLRPENILNKVNSIKSANKPMPTFNPLLTKPIDMRIDTSFLDEGLEELARDKEEAEKKETEFRESVVKALHGIEKNTALLTEMTMLLQKSNDKQDEMFKLVVEIMEIMKSANKEEADSKYTTVMRKITTFSENASTIQSLIGMAQTVYNALPF